MTLSTDVLDFILGVMDHREISHGNNETPTFQRPLSTGAVLRKGIELGRGVMCSLFGH